MEILTVGHSTHPLARLLELLEGASVEQLADVRRHPASRRHPQFNSDTLAATLPYLHLPELGGRRSERSGSPNCGWRVAAFRAYADHMATAEFAAGLARLEAAARERRTAVMCAEGLWWRCHRRLVADTLAVRGWTVRHLLPEGGVTDHELPQFAVVEEGGRVTYPAPQGRLI